MHIMCLQSFARTQNSRSLSSYCISALQLEFLVALQGILCSSVATTTMEPFFGTADAFNLLLYRQQL